MKGIKDQSTGRFVKNIPVTKNCLECSTAFSPRLESQKFCGRKCMGSFYKTAFNQKVVVDCNQCDKPIAFSPSRLKKVNNIFCNSECYGNWISKEGIFTGEKSHSWKGGITPISKKIRNSRKYKNWRTSVFERDNYTCVMCGTSPSGNLNVDHIVPFSKIIQEIRDNLGSDNILDKSMSYKKLWDISNGRTLCIDCHRNTVTYLNINNKHYAI